MSTTEVAGATRGPLLPADVGMVGIGRVGLGMCANLIDHGVGVVAFDVSPDARAEAVRLGARTVDHVGAVADAVDVVVLSLPTSNDVEEVVLGSSGLLASGTRRITTIVDTTSGDPIRTRRVAQAAAERDVTLVDVGVSGAGRGGGVTSAREGTLKLLVGGDDRAVDQLIPLLEVIGGEIVRCGPSGAGHATKSLHNLRAFAITAVTAETLVLGDALGLDLATLSHVIGTPPVLGELLQDPTRQSHVGFALALASKDCDVGIGLAHETGVTMAVATAAANVARAASADEGPDADYHAVLDAIARWSRRPRTPERQANERQAKDG